MKMNVNMETRRGVGRGEGGRGGGMGGGRERMGEQKYH